MISAKFPSSLCFLGLLLLLLCCAPLCCRSEDADIDATSALVVKVVPGSLSIFSSLLLHFNLELPVTSIQANGQLGLVVVTTLSTNPLLGFITGINYSRFFWSLPAPSAAVMVFSCPPSGKALVGTPRTEVCITVKYSLMHRILVCIPF